MKFNNSTHDKSDCEKKNDLVKQLTSELENNILKFWIDNTVDFENGGFYSFIDVDMQVDKKANRSSVICARILWTFSKAYNMFKKNEYLKMAERAYEYLCNTFYDKINGGIFWSVDYKGNVVHSKKQVYAQAFAIYGLTEYYKATSDSYSLILAKDLFDILENKCRDKQYGGYYEAFAQDWSPLEDASLSDKDLNVPKSMNTNLHVMEAYTNLLQVENSDIIRQALIGLIKITIERIIDSDTTISIDNYSVFSGTYDAENAAIKNDCQDDNVLIIDEYNDLAHLNKVVSGNELCELYGTKDGVLCKVYEDSSYTELITTQKVEDNNILVVSSVDNRTIQYYKVILDIPEEIVGDGIIRPDISCKLNGLDANNSFGYGNLEVVLTENENFVSPLLLVAHKRANGTLISCNSSYSDGTTAKVNLNISEVDGTIVTIYVWNENMSPLCEPITLYPGNGQDIGQRVFVNSDFSEGEHTGILLYEKSNSITVSDDVLTIKKTTSSDAYIESYISGLYRNVVFDTEIAIEERGMATPVTMFYFKGADASKNTRNAGIGSISNGKISLMGENFELEKISDEYPWARISLAVNINTSEAKLFINGNLKKEFDLQDDDGNLFKNINMWRIYVPKTAANGLLKINSMAIYEGVCPIDFDERYISEAPFVTNKTALNYLKDKTALIPESNIIFKNNVKSFTDVTCLNYKDEVLVSPDTAKKLFNVDVTIDENSITLGAARFTLNNKKMSYNNEEILLPVAPIKKDGIAMIPILTYANKSLGTKHFYNDGHGMLLISNNTIDKTKSTTKEANLYLSFGADSAKELKTKIIKNHNELDVHPRIMATDDDFLRIADEIKTDEYKNIWYANVLQSANGYVSENNNLTYALDSEDKLLNVAWKFENRAYNLGFVYQIEKIKNPSNARKYADRCIDFMYDVCNFPDWHIEHALDTGTIAQAFAVAYDWVYDAMSDTEKNYFAQKAIELGLEPAREIYYSVATDDTWWRKTSTNWSTWANAGISNLALAVAEINPDYCLDITSKALKAMQYGIYEIAPDGGWHEGPLYWHWFLKAFAYGMEGYRTSVGEKYDALNYMGIAGLGKFQSYFTGPSGNVNQYGDSDSGMISDSGQFFIGNMVGDLAIQKNRIDFMNKTNSEGGVADLLYYDINTSNLSQGEELPLDACFSNDGFVSMREKWTDDALWVSTHAGTLDSAHDQIDAGTFVLEMDGERWATDFGKEPMSYYSDSNNPAILAGYNSYYFYRRKGEGHNIVVINPDAGLEMDQTKEAKVIDFKCGVDSAFSVIDLSDVYNDDVEQYKRGYKISDNRSVFTLRDEISLKNANSKLYWFMHTKGDIEIVDSNTATITQNGKILKIEFVVDGISDFEIKEMAAEKLSTSPQFTETSNSEYSKLAVYCADADGDVSITARMSMLNDNIVSSVDTQAISAWTAD